ncbi:MAG: hypothetical protein RL632_2180 [Bacteroidota bacterium]|jgi:hypothetical protein
MDTKLTLKLEKMVIDRAKDYAKKQHTSLSRLIENYLLSLTNEPENEKITPLVKSLSGILDLPNDTDDKEGYGDYLTKKYK